MTSGADDLHPNGTDTIVLIHGLWVTALIWEQWIARYRARGYRVLAPGWPGLDRGVGELRRDPSRDRPSARDRHRRSLRPSDRRTRPCAGSHRALPRRAGRPDPARRRPWRCRRRDQPGTTGSTHVPAAYDQRRHPGPAQLSRRHSAVTLTARQFRRALTGALDDPQAETAYARYTIPAPGGLIRQAAFPGRTRVRFGNQARAPLLLIGGGKERIFPASLTRASSGGTPGRRRSLATGSTPADPTTRSASQAGNTWPTTRCGGPWTTPGRTSDPRQPSSDKNRPVWSPDRCGPGRADEHHRKEETGTGTEPWVCAAFQENGSAGMSGWAPSSADRGPRGKNFRPHSRWALVAIQERSTSAKYVLV